MNKIFRLHPTLFIWIMMIAKTVSEITGLEYVILLFGVLFSMCYIIRQGIELSDFKLLFPLMFLFVVQCVGFLKNPGIQALRTIIAVIGIWGIDRKSVV